MQKTTSTRGANSGEAPSPASTRFPLPRASTLVSEMLSSMSSSVTALGQLSWSSHLATSLWLSQGLPKQIQEGVPDFWMVDVWGLRTSGTQTSPRLVKHWSDVFPPSPFFGVLCSEGFLGEMKPKTEGPKGSPRSFFESPCLLQNEREEEPAARLSNWSWNRYSDASLEVASTSGPEGLWTRDPHPAERNMAPGPFGDLKKNKPPWPRKAQPS